MRLLPPPGSRRMGPEESSLDATRKRRARTTATAAVGLGCLVLSGLGAVDRLSYTVPPAYEFLALAANQPLWTWVFAACALAIGASLMYDREHVPALAATTGAIGVWSFLNLLWGLNPERPVSLAGPVLGAVVTALAYTLAQLWAWSDEHAKGR